MFWKGYIILRFLILNLVAMLRTLSDGVISGILEISEHCGQYSHIVKEKFIDQVLCEPLEAGTGYEKWFTYAITSLSFFSEGSIALTP
jgi:hypothetical protein